MNKLYLQFFASHCIMYLYICDVRKESRFMNGKHEAARFSRPVYKTSFSVTEELYESPTAKEPVFSRTLKGRFRIDLLRTLCVG